MPCDRGLTLHCLSYWAITLAGYFANKDDYLGLLADHS